VRASVSWLCWLVVFGALLSAPSFAAPIKLEDGKGALYISHQIEMLADPAQNLTIEQAVASHAFRPFGLMSDPRTAYWVRASVDATTSTDSWYLFFGYKPDKVDLYVPNASGGFTVAHSGIRIPYGDRPVRAYGVVAFELPKGVATTVYARIVTVEPDLTVAIDPSAVFWKVNEFNLLIIVAVDAVLGALFIGAIALYFMSRNSIFVLYSTYLLSELFYRSNSAGVVSAYLWPHAVYSPEQIGVIFDAIRIVALTMLLRYFLDLRRHSRLMDRFNVLVIAIAVMYGVLSIFGYPVLLSAARQFALIYVPIWLVSAIVAWRRGEQQAPLVVLAWAMFMVGTYAFALKQLIGFGRGNLTTELLVSHGTDIGIALQGLFLSLALSTELKQLSRARDRFEQLSVHDALTGVGNRRLFEGALQREWLRAMRSQKPISLVVIDIDYFKEYNDRYGHARGDIALCDVAKCGEEAMRGGDLFCRYGGEEFVGILPEADEAGALRVAERVQKIVTDANILSERAPSGYLTVSIGVVTMVPDTESSPSSLFERADQALYRAKGEGRNRIEVSRVV
jgi:diguanylate cyclase (GGDEF)-like protein